ARPRSSPDGPRRLTEKPTGKDGRFTIRQLPNLPLALMAYIGPPPKTNDHSMRFSAAVDTEPGQTDARIVLDPNAAPQAK
ncbi:MAG: hypothetical protein NTW96_17425, partial [Planctomycetia bacterium]|nr:hypothetical protein [Planctomycetia bacterium]